MKSCVRKLGFYCGKIATCENRCNPTYMAVYLLAIVGVSILIGSIYEKNTFCRYVCPVGHLLGLYSRLSFLGWRVKDKRVCDTCKDKSCIHKKYHYNLNDKSCGVDFYPAKIEDNTHCILCAGCLKTCSKYQSDPNSDRPNPGFKHIGFANDLFKLKPLKMAEFVFVLIVSGLTTTQKILDGEIVLQQTPIWANLIVSVLLTLIIGGAGYSI